MAYTRYMLSRVKTTSISDDDYPYRLLASTKTTLLQQQAREHQQR